MCSLNAFSWYTLFCVFPAVLLQALALSPAARTAAAGPPRRGTCWPRSLRSGSYSTRLMARARGQVWVFRVPSPGRGRRASAVPVLQQCPAMASAVLAFTSPCSAYGGCHEHNPASSKLHSAVRAHWSEQCVLQKAVEGRSSRLLTASISAPALLSVIAAPCAPRREDGHCTSTGSRATFSSEAFGLIQVSF